MVERILALAKQKGLKQAFLEEKIGAYRGKITEWKNKKSSPTDVELKIVAELLGTTEAYLRGKTDDPAPAAEPTDDVQIEILARAARKMTTEEKQKLIDIAKVMFEKAFDENK